MWLILATKYLLTLLHVLKKGGPNNSKIWPVYDIFYSIISYEAGATFDNSFFDNCFGFLRQCKNRSFLGSVFVHVTGRSQN
jgi:hypothetical protein